MDSSFRIPKKQQQSGSSIIGMTSPLSRLQEDVTSKVHWNQSPKKPNRSGLMNASSEMKPGSYFSQRWRPKRASDSLCQQKEDTQTPTVKKQLGSSLTETSRPSPHCNAKESEIKESTKQEPVVRKGNGQITKSSLHPHKEVEVPEKRLKFLNNEGAASVSVPKAKSDSPKQNLRLRLSRKTYQRAKPSSSEPIVLSSGDEDEDANEGHCKALWNAGALQNKTVQKSSSKGQILSSSVLELAFSCIYFGKTQTHANGPITITEDSISIPLKGGDGEGENVSVSLVPSELRAYGLWNSESCRLNEQQGSSSSLLFLSLTDAQSRLLYKELSSIYNMHTTGSPCPFVLVALTGRLDDMQHASLASLMDLMALKNGRPDMGNSLSRAEGVRRLVCHPHGAYFLQLLGCKEGNNQENQNGTKINKALEVMGSRQASLRSSTRRQGLPRRLIQFPPPPSKGGITVTTEDLECLRDGEFLNDVIIDFYLKYLHLERADLDVANRSHIFSSFFYKQLTRKDNCSEEEVGCTAQYRRHRRVQTWTRNVDIFSKDYLFIPVNQEAHWYLVVICFPGLLQSECVAWRTSQAAETKAEEVKGRTKHGSLTSHGFPDCTAVSCQRQMVTRRPCILIMDSLKLSSHNRIYILLREYLQAEWEVRRDSPRVFTEDSIKGSNCKVPLQDNSSDCGLYLLQYAESFLQNPVVHFELPLRLERWFPRQQVHRKRAELRELVLQLYRREGGEIVQNTS